MPVAPVAIAMTTLMLVLGVGIGDSRQLIRLKHIADLRGARG